MDSVGHPVLTVPQELPVPMPEPLSEPVSGAMLAVPRPWPFEVFGAYWMPKSKPAICGDR